MLLVPRGSVPLQQQRLAGAPDSSEAGLRHGAVPSGGGGALATEESPNHAWDPGGTLIHGFADAPTPYWVVALTGTTSVLFVGQAQVLRGAHP